MSGTPLVSIIIPVHNREATIERCLRSVFAQLFTDFEVIAVDDASTDASLAMLRATPDPRLLVLSHATNRGVCPARNTGIARARGEWVVLLDDDDEFASPAALGRMAELARAAPRSLHALWFRCRLDDGSLSPADPLPIERDWDYRGYLRFLQATHGRSRDMIRCVRRSCFDRIRYPDSRMLEEKFHLDFAASFRSRLHPEVLRLYHQDAPNGTVRRLASREGTRDRTFVADRASGMRALIRRHGRALAREAPDVFKSYRIRSVNLARHAGPPAAAISAAIGLAARTPLDPRAWGLLLAALAALIVGPEPIADIMAKRHLVLKRPERWRMSAPARIETS